VHVAEDHLNSLDEIRVFEDGRQPCSALHQLLRIVQIEPAKLLLAVKDRQRLDTELSAGESDGGLFEDVCVR
jgi:hypothetical protein